MGPVPKLHCRQTPTQATRNQDSSNSKKRKVKEKDAYDSVPGGDDESWSTLSAKKKKGKLSTGLGVGSSPRCVFTFTVPALF